MSPEVYALLAARWTLAVILFAAGIAKVTAGRSFRSAIANYGFVPNALEGPMAILVPVGELVLAFCLGLGVLPSIAGWIASAMLFSFACVVAINLLRGKHFGCGCGVHGGAGISWRLVLEDMVLVAIATSVAVGPASGLSLWPGSAAVAGPSASFGELVPIPMSVIVVAVMVRIGKLVRDHAGVKGFIPAYLRRGPAIN